MDILTFHYFFLVSRHICALDFFCRGGNFKFLCSFTIKKKIIFLKNGLCVNKNKCQQAKDI